MKKVLLEYTNWRNGEPRNGAISIKVPCSVLQANLNLVPGIPGAYYSGNKATQLLYHQSLVEDYPEGFPVCTQSRAGDGKLLCRNTITKSMRLSAEC